MKKIILIAFCSLVFGNVNQQELVIDIEKNLMAPCCWSGTVFGHGHGQLEQEIESMVAAGQTKDQIMNYYVQIYGERILAVPVAQGFNVMAWLVPIFIAIIGVIFLVLYFKSSGSISLDLKSAGKVDESIPYDEQIEKELKNLD